MFQRGFSLIIFQGFLIVRETFEAKQKQNKCVFALTNINTSSNQSEYGAI